MLNTLKRSLKIRKLQGDSHSTIGIVVTRLVKDTLKLYLECVNLHYQIKTKIWLFIFIYMENFSCHH